MSDNATWLNFQGSYKESGEALWYQSYTDGRPSLYRKLGDARPVCNRLSRLARIAQLGMAIDLAADVWTGDVIYRGCADNTVTGEEYWFWPGRPEGKYGHWWMLPARTSKIARRAMEHAMAAAEASQRRRGRRAAERRLMATWTPISHEDAVLIELRRLQRRARRAAAAAVTEDYVPAYWHSPLPPLPAPRAGERIDYCAWPEWARPAGAIYTGATPSAYRPASAAWAKFSHRAKRAADRAIAAAEGRLMQHLHHITLTTGHVAATPRSAMRDGIAEMIRPVLQAGGGDLGGIPVEVLYRGPESATLAIGEPRVALMTVCWADPDVSRQLWTELGTEMAAPEAPWCAVSLHLPVQAMLPPDTQAMLGDLERCIAWTLIEDARQ